MKRYEPNEEDDMDIYSDEQNYEKMISAIDIEYYKMTQDSDRRLLLLTIKVLENSFFWKFKTKMSKLKAINESYQILKNIIQSDKGV